MASQQQQVADKVAREVEKHSYQAILDYPGNVIRVVVMGENSIGCVQVLPGSQPSAQNIEQKVYNLIYGGTNPVTV